MFVEVCFDVDVGIQFDLSDREGYVDMALLALFRETDRGYKVLCDQNNVEEI